MKRQAEPAAGASLTLGSGESAGLRRAAAPLTLPERAHLDLRFRSAPWKRVVEAFEPDGRLVDFGCGPGLLAHLLQRAGFQGTYLGLDSDARKVDRARRWLPESPARIFRAGTVDAATPGAFSQAALIDVLYLVPPPERADFLARAVRALTPGGLFVALTSGGGPGWKRRLDSAQERLAVGLGVTRGGGVATCDGAEIARLLEAAGLTGAAVVDVGRGFLHGFELVLARRPLT
ncbi:MAG: class I SAM-dependent methyltransferase [Thermoanaerobaculia bacterium]|nr:class I SAM-dependent methyltransferase [Thermoanaerobaculia bacterium]